jgi:hypothetical protein
MKFINTTNHIDQAAFTVKQYTISELSQCASALDEADQAPLSDSNVSKLTKSITANGLLTPLCTALYDGSTFLVSGRNRLASMEASTSPMSIVTVLEYEVDTAEELIELIVQFNSSRRMAAKVGCGVNTPEQLVAKLCTVDNAVAARAMLVLALGLTISDTFEQTGNTGYTVARSFISKFSKCKVSIVEPAKYDDDGTQLTTAATHKVDLLTHIISQGSDRVHEFINVIVNAINVIYVTPVEVSVKNYQALMDKGRTDIVVTNAERTIKSGTTDTLAYLTTIEYPEDWQRSCASYMTVAFPAIMNYVYSDMELN